MKKNLIAIFVGQLLMIGCTSDNLEQYYGVPECNEVSASFQDDILPIISTHCAIPNCHADGTAQPTFETYQQIESRASLIKQRTSNGTMPPASSGISLTANEVKKISCWVNNGANNN